MTDQTRTKEGEGDEQLADWVADLAERIARGETPDVRQLEALHSGAAKSLLRLLPAIRLLSELADEDGTEDHPPALARPPDVLGDFRLGREIGRGGIGVVYEARQISLGAAWRSRFYRRRRCWTRGNCGGLRSRPRRPRRFEHPHIVPVFAYGTERGVPYFAMH